MSESDGGSGGKGWFREWWDRSWSTLVAGGLLAALISGGFTLYANHAADSRSTREFLRQHRVEAYTEFIAEAYKGVDQVAWISNEFSTAGSHPWNAPKRQKAVDPANASTTLSAQTKTAEKYSIITLLEDQDSDRAHLAFRITEYFRELSSVTQDWLKNGPGAYEDSLQALSNRFAHVGNCDVSEPTKCFADKASAHAGDPSVLNSSTAVRVEEVIAQLARAVRGEALAGSDG